MADKKMYFFKISLNNTELSFKEVFNKAVEKQSIKGDIIDEDGNKKDIKLISLNLDKKNTFDIIEDEGELLFCRMGKEKQSGTMTTRENTRHTTQSVLSEEDLNSKHLETLTHLYIDFKYDIIAYVGELGGAKPYIIENIIENFDDKIEIEIVPIMEEESIRKLIKDNSLIDGINLKYARPNHLFLQKLGMPSELATVISENSDFEINIEIKSNGRNNPLLYKKNKIKQFINYYQDQKKKNKIKKVNATGKESLSDKKREYSFDELKFTRNVPIKLTEKVEGKERQYLDYEYTWECRNKMSEQFTLKLRKELYVLTRNTEIE